MVQEEAQAARPSAPPPITDESLTPPDDKTGTLSVAPQVTDSKDGVLGKKNKELPEEGGNLISAEESEPRDIATKESSNFSVVTIKKGESLIQIATRFFPADPLAGMKAIIAANPQIRDQNRILAGQTIRVPQNIQERGNRQGNM